MKARARGRGRSGAFAATLFALCLLCPPPAPAQDAAQTAAGGALKLDEYGLLGHCDLGARLGNLANFLQENPGATGYVVAYDPAKGSPGIARRSAQAQRQYLIDSYGVDEERVVAVAGGRYAGAELKSELWIVPPGARPPAEAPREESEPPFFGKFAAFGMDDDSSFDHSGEMDGPGSISTTRHAFADVLKRQPKSKAYLVAYADGGRAPGAWRRFATSEKSQLEALGVEPSRLSVVNGGERKESEVELWIMPEDAPPPVKPKKREKRLRAAAMIGTYKRFKDNDDADERKWLLNNLAEMLREDPQRVGCLVVFRDDDAPPDAEEVSGQVESAFDYVALAGEWRRELSERYGIEAHRVVLLVGRAGVWGGSSAETWVAPKGVALPDPALIVKRREARMNAGADPGDAEKP